MCRKTKKNPYAYAPSHKGVCVSEAKAQHTFKHGSVWRWVVTFKLPTLQIRRNRRYSLTRMVRSWADLDMVAKRKSRVPAGNQASIFWLIASEFIDWCIPAQNLLLRTAKTLHERPTETITAVIYLEKDTCTEHQCQVFSTPAPYLGGSGFKSRPRSKAILTEFFVYFLSSSRRVQGYNFKIRPRHLPPPKYFPLYQPIITLSFDAT
jgi:hypothetical protein